jgi:hypothetical protein
MPTIEEKRVYADRTGQREVYVASSVGVVVVNVSDDLVGEFSLAKRCDPRDIAGGDGRVAVATAADVLALTDASFEPVGFESAVAVDFDEDAIVASDETGTIARRPAATAGATPAASGDWTEIGTVESPVTAIDWPFVATASGLYRAVDGEFESAGLDGVNDVSGAGMPLAATDAGLYKLGNGWMSVLDGAFHAVASDGRRAHAATDRALYENRTDWEPVDVPVAEPVQDIAYTPEATVCVTESGTLLLTVGDGWRTRQLGVGGVVGVAVR